MSQSEFFVVANGQKVQLVQELSLEDFLRSQNLLPKSLVVELNGEAVAPSEFSQRIIKPGDRMEIVKIVAGG
jgi:thiamine biosynthesis protein ThiS